MLTPRHPLVVGSFGNSGELHAANASNITESCDLVEIRIDLLDDPAPASWAHLTSLPLLFTCRRKSEGGRGALGSQARAALLEAALPDAALIDIEVASIPEMPSLIAQLNSAEIPWIASAHDFSRAPSIDILEAGKLAAFDHGAAAFKAAVELGWEIGQLAPLGLFLKESEYPISLMGMGPLAPVSRVLFAQLGSVLNYGYLGSVPTAPGQWSASQLKQAIRAVTIA